MKAVQSNVKNQNCFRVPAAEVTKQRTRILKTTLNGATKDMHRVGWWWFIPPGDRSPSPSWIGGWVGPRTRLDAAEKI